MAKVADRNEKRPLNNAFASALKGFEIDGAPSNPNSKVENPPDTTTAQRNSMARGQLPESLRSPMVESINSALRRRDEPLVRDALEVLVGKAVAGARHGIPVELWIDVAARIGVALKPEEFKEPLGGGHHNRSFELRSINSDAHHATGIPIGNAPGKKAP